MSTVAVDQAYAEVQRVTRERAKNFAYGIMVLPAEKRRAIAAVYAFAREVDDVADGDLPLDEKRAQLEALRSLSDDAAPTTPDGRCARRRTCTVRHSDARARGARRRRAPGHRAGALRVVRRAARLLREGCGRSRRCVRRGVRLRRRRACAHARDRAAADQHHARRRRGLGARPRVPAAGRARAPRRRRGRPRARPGDACVAIADVVPGRARTRASRRRPRSCSTRSTGAARSCVSTFAGLYSGQLDRIEANGFDVFGPSCRLSTPAKLAVVARGLVR